MLLLPPLSLKYQHTSFWMKCQNAAKVTHVCWAASRIWCWGSIEIGQWPLELRWLDEIEISLLLRRVASPVWWCGIDSSCIQMLLTRAQKQKGQWRWLYISQVSRSLNTVWLDITKISGQQRQMARCTGKGMEVDGRDGTGIDGNGMEWNGREWKARQARERKGKEGKTGVL